MNDPNTFSVVIITYELLLNVMMKLLKYDRTVRDDGRANDFRSGHVREKSSQRVVGGGVGLIIIIKLKGLVRRAVWLPNRGVQAA